MKKKFFMAAAVATVCMAAFVAVKSISSNDREFTALELANIEALTESEASNAVFEIVPYDCTISGNGKIKLGNGKIISLSGDGSITITGARDCKYNESAGYLCSPIMCTELYQIIF